MCCEYKTEDGVIVGNLIIKIIRKDNAQHAILIIDGDDPNTRYKSANYVLVKKPIHAKMQHLQITQTIWQVNT